MFQWLRSLEGDRLVYGENFFVEPFWILRLVRATVPLGGEPRFRCW